jgi:hypothetical protein
VVTVRTARKAGSLLGLLVAGGLLVFVGMSVVIAHPFLDIHLCTIPQHAVAAPYWIAFVVAGALAFGLGRLLGYWRDSSSEPAEHDPPGDSLLAADEVADRQHRHRAFAVQLVLASTLTLVSGLLAYESWAELASPPRSPITDFVRCASQSQVAFPQTLVAVVALLFLAGHWLWHPARRPR